MTLAGPPIPAHLKQALAINTDLFDKLLVATEDSMREIQNRALLLVAYKTLFRRNGQACPKEKM